MFTGIVTLDDPKPQADLLLRPGENLLNGERAFRDAFSDLTSLEVDVLNVASAIFACDISFKRGKAEQYTRQIKLTVPVVNYAAFASALPELKYALWVLSRDAWEVQFVAADGQPEARRRWSDGTKGKVLLFSGGLDSLAAAVKFAREKEPVQLVRTGFKTVVR